MQIPALDYRTTDPALVIKALEQAGAIILKDVLSPDHLSFLDQEVENLLAETQNCEGIFHGYRTKRVGGMIGKSKICQRMAIDPTVLAVMDHFLLPHCDNYQINLTQLISIGQGEAQQIIHADDPLFPFDNPYEIMINVMWMVDDFTAANGATHIAPGSHLWPRDREPADTEILQAEGAKGSCLIWLGSLRHGGGANKTDQWRRGIVISYCLGWLRQSENQYLACPPEVAKTFPEPLQKLAGYTVHKPNLGLVNGLDPIYMLQDNYSKKLPGFQDHMPDHIKDLLTQHYAGKKVMVA